VRLGARALLLVLLAAPSFAAEAPLVGFDSQFLPGGTSFFSADGYHLAALDSTATEDIWTVNGKVRARGPRGTFPEGGVISADGSVLLHTVVVPGGVRAALNGRPYGAVYAAIENLTISARGENGAFAAKTPKGWAVVSAQGVGPAFPAQPTRLEVTETSTQYVVDWQKQNWLYVDHRPVRAFVTRTGNGSVVEIDGQRYGPYASVSAVAYSPNGRHWAFQPGDTGRNSKAPAIVIVDGRTAPAHRCACTLVVDDTGRVFQDELLIPIPKGEVHTFYLEGKELYRGGRPPRVATSPDGSKYVYPMLSPFGGSIGMNGALLRKHAPIPLSWSPLVFDGPTEFHYWSVIGDRLHLICATTDGSDSLQTRCAGRSTKNGWALVP